MRLTVSFRGSALLLSLALLVGAPALGAAAEPVVTEGVASWYGAEFQGRKTANGEVFDKEQLTCAHRTIAFGTFLLVRNLDSGASVVVRVNDRGPFAKDRILDLSEGAARLVGMLPTGTARVSFSILPAEEALAWKGGGLDGASPGLSGSAGPAKQDVSPNASATGKAAAPASTWRIQVASYRDEANARATAERLAAAGLAASIERAGAFHRVVFAGLDEEGARRVASRLDILGYRGYSMTSSSPR